MPLTRRLRAINSFLRNVFARETLDEAPCVTPPSRGAHVAAMLFGREPLAIEPELPPARGRAGDLLRALLAPETLPEDPPAPAKPAKPGMLRMLFAPEALAERPPAPPRPPRSEWLRWLFRPEDLDPPGR